MTIFQRPLIGLVVQRRAPDVFRRAWNAIMIGQQLSQMGLAGQVPAEFSYAYFGSLGSESANCNEGLLYVHPVGPSVYFGDTVCSGHCLLPGVLGGVEMEPRVSPDREARFRDTQEFVGSALQQQADGPGGDRARRSSRRPALRNAVRRRMTALLVSRRPTRMNSTVGENAQSSRGVEADLIGIRDDQVLGEQRHRPIDYVVEAGRA